MDKDIARLIKRNKDVVDFIRGQLEEKPELKLVEIIMSVAREFGAVWLNRRFCMLLLIAAAKGKWDDDNREYSRVPDA